MNDYLVVYIEFFLINIDNEKIIQQFQNMKMCSEI